MKSNKIPYKLAVLLLLLGPLCLPSCEPEYCAACYDYSGLFRNKAMVICADDPGELDYMMDEVEYSLGYVCEYE